MDYPTDHHSPLAAEYGFDVLTWSGFPVLRQLRELRLVTSLLPVLNTNPRIHPSTSHNRPPHAWALTIPPAVYGRFLQNALPGAGSRAILDEMGWSTDGDCSPEAREYLGVGLRCGRVGACRILGSIPDRARAGVRVGELNSGRRCRVFSGDAPGRGHMADSPGRFCPSLRFSESSMPSNVMALVRQPLDAKVGFEELPKMSQGPARYVPMVNDSTKVGVVYPRRSLVLVTGVPGAGKSTLLRRLFGLRGNEERTVLTAEGVRVIDSLQSRCWLRTWLGRVPYPLWRWVVHVLHLARTAVALRGGPVVVHECGTRGPVRALLVLLRRLRRYGMHVLMLDATPQEARNGQNARGRRVTERSHRVHSRRWRRLRAAARHGPSAFAPGARSLFVLDRRRARDLVRIRFDPCASTGDPLHAAVESPPVQRCAREVRYLVAPVF